MAFPRSGLLHEQPLLDLVPDSLTFGAVVGPGPTLGVASVASATHPILRDLDPHLVVHEQARVGIEDFLVLTFERDQVPDDDVVARLPVHPDALNSLGIHAFVGHWIGLTVAVKVCVDRNEAGGLSWLGRDRHGLALVDTHHANLGVTLGPLLGTRAQTLQVHPTRARKLADAHAAGSGHSTMAGATVHDPLRGLLSVLLHDRARHGLSRHGLHLLGLALHGHDLALNLADLDVDLVHLRAEVLREPLIRGFQPCFHDRDLRDQDALLHTQRLDLQEVAVASAEALRALVGVPVVEVIGAGGLGGGQEKDGQHGQKDGFDGLHGVPPGPYSLMSRPRVFDVRGRLENILKPTS